MNHHAGQQHALSQDFRILTYELALSVGLSRSALAADLAELRRRGLISTGRRRIEIRDLPGLRGISNSDRDAEQPPSAERPSAD